MAENPIRRNQGVHEAESRYLENYDPQVRRVYRLIVGACGYARSSVFPWYDSDETKISEGTKVLSSVDRIYSLAYKDNVGELNSDHISDAVSAYILLKIGLQKSKEPTPEMYILFNFALPVVNTLLSREGGGWDMDQIKAEAVSKAASHFVPTRKVEKPPIDREKLRISIQKF